MPERDNRIKSSAARISLMYGNAIEFIGLMILDRSGLR